jgi:phosphoserine phosphatase RsbU/P
VYVAQLDTNGLVAQANAALRDGAGQDVIGLPVTDLLHTQQQAAFESWLAQTGGDWRSSAFSFAMIGGGTEERFVWTRRLDDGATELIAEPPWVEHGRLVEQVLQLNDDLISAQRRLTRRSRELELAQDDAAASARRVGQLERILLAGLTQTDFDRALGSLLEMTRELLPGDRAELRLLDDTSDGLVLRAASGELMDAALDEGWFTQVAADGVAAIVQDLRSSAPPSEGSVIAAPLVVDGEVAGLLSLRAGMPGSFGDADLQLLGHVGERVSLAIGQAQLRRREQRMAETLQRTLLPQRLPEVPGVELCARYRARAASVGGDFYDALELPDGRVGLAIGDVTGKGLRAAATMGRLRAALHAYAIEHPRPADVLARLSRLAEADGTFATALYLTLDPATGAVELASAGHLPPLVIGREGAHYLELGAELSPLLGLPDGPGEPGRFTLAPGESLVAFTDGLVESTRDVDEGLGTLRAAAAEQSAVALGELCDGLLGTLSPTGRARDDVALVAVRRS